MALSNIPFSFLHIEPSIDAIYAHTEEQYQDLLQRMHDTIVTSQPSDLIAWFDWFEQLATSLGYDEDNTINVAPTRESIVDLCSLQYNFVLRLFKVFQFLGYLNLLDETSRAIQNTFRTIMESLHSAQESYWTRFEATHMAKRLHRNSTANDPPQSLVNLSSVWIDKDSIVGFQHLMLFVLREMGRSGFKRIGEDCFKQLVVDGHPTYYWQFECSIMTFIYTHVKKECAFDKWCHILAGRDVSKAIKQCLANGVDEEFIELKPTRKLFSFKNGLYNLEENVFQSYTDLEITQNDSDSRASIRYFDVEFDEEWATCSDYNDIPTTDFDSIFHFQAFDLETINWAYIMLGRVLYSVGEKDNWQVGVFFKGVACSGKSTIGNIMKYVYPPGRVGTLSSNGEDKFGLSALYDKLLFVCTEVKSNFVLNQGDWQSMVTGEDVAVAIKHKCAINKKWDVPGVLCGNEVPGWADAAGSVVRRIVLFDFPKKVRDGDPHLFTKLKDSIGAFICKINRAYLTAVEEFGNQDLWKPGILPNRLIKANRELQCEVDGLTSFLQNDSDIMFDKDKYILEKEFREAYKKYAQRKGLVASDLPIQSSHRKKVYDEHEITIENGIKRWPDTTYGKNMKGIYLMGVCLRENVESADLGFFDLSSGGADMDTRDAARHGDASHDPNYRPPLF